MGKGVNLTAKSRGKGRFLGRWDIEAGADAAVFVVTGVAADGVGEEGVEKAETGEEENGGG